MNYNFIQKINIVLMLILLLFEGILLALNNAIGFSIASALFYMIICIAFGVYIGRNTIT